MLEDFPRIEILRYISQPNDMTPEERQQFGNTVLQVTCGHSKGFEGEGVLAQLKAFKTYSWPSLASPMALIPLTLHSGVCTALTFTMLKQRLVQPPAPGHVPRASGLTHARKMTVITTT